jgi:hypothetical protein
VICADCDRLWRGYAEAIHGQLQALRRSHADAVREDSLALMKSEWEERALVRKRQRARKALTEHQVTHLVNEMDTRKRRSTPSKKKR